MMATTRKGRASRHAQRSWTCPCGRTVFGNGGKGSHQRACRVFKESRVVSMERTLVKMKDGINSSYRGVSERVLVGWIEKWTHDLEVAKKDLAGVDQEGS